MDRGLRVLVLTTLFPHHPGEKEGNFVLDQVRALAKQKADVTVLVARPWNPLPFLAPKNKRNIDESVYAEESFRVRNTNYFSLPRFALGVGAYKHAAGVFLKAADIAREWQFDVVHAHGFLMGYVANSLEAPSVITIHGIETDPRFDDTDGKREKLEEVLNRADQVVLVGSPLIEHCKKYASRTDHFTVVGNGCTVHPDLQPSQNIPRRRPQRVVAVSNYEESKGFDLLVEALADGGLQNQFELVIVGGGGGFKRLKDRVRELGVDGSVHFTGLLSHQDALAEVMAADIFCLPSWREAFGIMYAEAMTLGKLAMGCQGQGPSDFIRHKETGYLMEPGSTSAVIEALRWAIEHPEDASRAARAGQEYALHNLTWDANASRMMEVFREAISARTQGAKNRTAMV